MWERRLSGDSIWLIEFYAPWCSHCQTFASEYKKTAVLLADDDIEAGAINCAKEQGLCGDRFGIRSYPTVRLINREHGTQQEFHNTNGLLAAPIAAWAKEVAAEWAWLFHAAKPARLNASNFAEEVSSSTALWLVLFTDGFECGPCKTASTNMLRLAAGLDGMARVGVVDCEPAEMHDYCQTVHGMPLPPHAPQIKAWRRGKKATDDPGEVLYNANEVEPHLALELAERTIRLALSETVPAEEDAAAEEESEGGVDLLGNPIKGNTKFEKDAADGPPPPPPPQR